MCRLYEVTRAGYYAWRTREPSARRLGNERLLKQIEQVHASSGGTYGSPRIQAAFPLAPLPDMSLHQAQLADQSMSREIPEQEWIAAGWVDAERSWQAFGDDELLACDAALAHLEETAFVYYLPAFLIFAVHHCAATWPDPSEALVGSTVFSVTQRGPHNLGRYKRLNPEQRAAVVAFLEFIAENGNHSERPQAEKALKRYWKTDEASKPLIVVP
jgi:hypothetical protein